MAGGAAEGDRVGKYQILGTIGRGGMGRVYEALNPTIGKRVALKLIDPSIAADAAAAARFAREAQAASAASSPHIVSIFDAGVAEDGSPFIVMELLDGESLGARLDREGRLDVEETIRISTQILRGLARAHAAGIVHRDLKPDNVFLVDREHEPALAKILDFGVSKIDTSRTTTTLTREGAVIGTPAYMSPEQAQADGDIDARSDLWSLGAIMYECLSGRLPFRGESYERMIVDICSQDPTPLSEVAPDVPSSLRSVVERCLRRSRDERFSSADALLEALGQPTLERPSRPRAVLKPDGAAAATGTAPTVEAPRRHSDGELVEVLPRTRYAVPIAGAMLAACLALVLGTRTDPLDAAAAAEDAAAETIPASALGPAPPAAEPREPPPAPAPTTEDVETAGDEAAPRASAAATTPSPAPVVVRPWPKPTPAPETSAATTAKPRGIAGGLELQSE